MRVLITGGTGFLGLNVAEALLGQGHEVLLHGHVPPPEAALDVFGGLPGRLRVELGDVRDGPAVGDLLRRFAPDRLLHGAAITPGPERERADPASILAVNVVGTATVLQAAREAGVPRVVAMSSGSAYGAAQEGRERLDEADAHPRPATVYGISKFAAEATALRLAALWDMDLTAVRLGSLFGRWEWASGVRDVLSPLTQLSVAALEGRPAVLPGPGPLDWLYTADAARGLLAILASDRLRGRVCNLGSGRVWSVADWAERLAARHPAFRWRLADDPAEATVRYLVGWRPPLGTARLAEATGFVAACGPDEAFADYLPWLERHRVPT